MKKKISRLQQQESVLRVRRIIIDRLNAALNPVSGLSDFDVLYPGKMLRTRLASRLACAESSVDLNSLERCCAAVELVHAASLCHDDVIDGGVIRRAMPSLWQKTGCSAAVLVGDMLVCEAISVILPVDDGAKTGIFMEKIRQTVSAEARQELLYRGSEVDEATCIALAREKTGALFSFAAMLGGGSDKLLTQTLEECGYLVGTAYQLADDLLDVIGEQNSSGKTLGTDAKRGKNTLANQDEHDFSRICELITELCETSLDSLQNWPQSQQAMRDFLTQDLQPVFDKQNLPLDMNNLSDVQPHTAAAMATT